MLFEAVVFIPPKAYFKTFKIHRNFIVTKSHTQRTLTGGRSAERRGEPPRATAISMTICAAASSQFMPNNLTLDSVSFV